MNTPVYREMVRLLNNKMNVSRNTVYNWFVKGHDGAEVSVIYHTFIETCKMCGVSTLEYFKEFFKAAIKRVQFRVYSRIVEREQVRLIIRAIMQGRTDYERSALPLATIGTQEYVTDDHRY